MSRTKATYHVVFGTKGRQQTITPEHRKELYAYIFGILQKYECYVYRINGMADHIHILFNLNPTIALSSLIKSIKQSSSKWIKTSIKFPYFSEWGRGYYGYTLSSDHIDAAIEYIKNQQEHHNVYGYLQEIRDIANREGWEWHDDDLS